MKIYPLLFAALMIVGCGCGSDSAATSNAPSTSPASQTPNPTASITEEQLGVKMYPGARVVTSGETPEVVSANLETTDEAAKVVSFYEGELGATGTGDPVMTNIS